MSTQLSRKELKQDKFAVEVEHTVDFFSAHRKEVTRYGSVAIVVVLIAAAVYYFRSSRAQVREQVLGEAIALQNAPVAAQAPPTGGPSFPTDAAKNAAVDKAFQKIVSDDSGSKEAYIAEYFLASRAADDGKFDDARKKYQDVADHADANYASLAKLELAEIDLAQNRASEAQNLLKDLMDHPTDLVSKPQATIAYAKAIGQSKPDEARKLLSALITPGGDSAGIASAALSDLPK